MLHQTPAIILNTLKYGDTSLIIHLYTELFGQQTYMLKGVRKLNKGGGSNAHLLLPTCILDIVVTYQPQKNFQVLKEFHLKHIYTSNSIAKNCIQVFIVELLQKCTITQESNPEIYELTENILKYIDEQPLNLLLLVPQYYAIQLIGYLGYSIHSNYNMRTPYFDLQAGEFTNAYVDEHNSCNIQTSELIHHILQSDVDALNIINADAHRRKEVLTKLIQYYQLHIPNMPNLTSLQVVASVLG